MNTTLIEKPRDERKTPARDKRVTEKRPTGSKQQAKQSQNNRQNKPAARPTQRGG